MAEQTGVWLDSQPVSGAPGDVFARFRAVTPEDVAEDRERRNRSALLRQKAEDEADAVRMGFATAPPSHVDVLMRAAVLADLQDAAEERRRQADLEDRAERALTRLAAAEAELAAERESSARSLRRANEAAAAFRARAVEAERFDQRQYLRTRDNYWG
jgi:hypothetical protein